MHGLYSQTSNSLTHPSSCQISEQVFYTANTDHFSAAFFTYLLSTSPLINTEISLVLGIKCLDLLNIIIKILSISKRNYSLDIPSQILFFGIFFLLPLGKPSGRVFVMTMVDCSRMFIKPDGVKTDSMNTEKFSAEFRRA